MIVIYRAKNANIVIYTIVPNKRKIKYILCCPVSRCWLLFGQREAINMKVFTELSHDRDAVMEVSAEHNQSVRVEDDCLVLWKKERRYNCNG